MLTLLESAELEALRNFARKAITGLLEDAEFYYTRASTATNEAERMKAENAGNRRREAAENLTAYTTRLEQLLQQAADTLPIVKRESYAIGYNAGQQALTARNPHSTASVAQQSTMQREATKLKLQDYNRRKFGESTEGQWYRGQYIGHDQKINKRYQQ